MWNNRNIYIYKNVSVAKPQVLRMYEIELTDYSRNEVRWQRRRGGGGGLRRVAGGGRSATEHRPAANEYVISALVPHNKLLTGRVT